MDWRIDQPVPERQMLGAYFDTTVYSDIEKGWVAKDVVDASGVGSM